MEEDIKSDLMQIACNNPFFSEIVENTLNYIKQLEEENKKMAEEYLVNNSGMTRYLNENYIFKSKVKEKIEELKEKRS